MKHCFMMRSDVKRPPRKSDMRNLKPATHLAILYAHRRDRRKSPGVPGAAIVISPIAAIGVQIRRHSPSVAVPAIFYVYCCESPVKPTHQVGRFITWVFKTATSPRSAKKNRQVCPHQSLAKIACDFRWRSNSPRSAKIARCVRCRDCDFRRSPRSAYKIADIWRVRYRRLNSPAFAKCARSRDFLRSLLQIASKTSPSG